MLAEIEKEIYDLRCLLNRIVSKDINLTDKRVLKLSVKLDRLLNALHSAKSN